MVTGDDHGPRSEHSENVDQKGKLPGNHITNETSKRVGLHPQKETTPENLAFHGFKQKTQMKHEAET